MIDDSTPSITWVQRHRWETSSARFATRLKPQQRAGLSLPIRKGTRRFYEFPTYSVFYQVLIRMDPEAFARKLNDWLAAPAGTLPTALCRDGKMIREHFAAHPSTSLFTS